MREYEHVRERLHAALAQGCDAEELMVIGLAEHDHEWLRVMGTAGLFACAVSFCSWYAVCPGCLNSLDVALRARDGIPGVALYWCSQHRGESGEVRDGL